MDLLDILSGFVQDPISYSILFFVYVILAAVILPIPVEIGLFNPFINPVLLIFILSIGKGIGALIVFEIGIKLRSIFKKLVKSPKITKKIIYYCERFVKKYGYFGLFIIMSIPLMIDSASLYLFSVLNSRKNGKRAMARNWFVLINIFAGAVRGGIIIILAYVIGIRLV
ncbi:MAG: hypothetical protein JXA91_07660 [Candidatus Thermoplasmatota archaeon]|nr:hypothetical protein [Candidatus Thermoplasmatota archaeon]